MLPFRPATLATPAVLALGLLLSACQKPPAPVAEAPPPLPPHLGPPPASLCTVTPFKVSDGGQASIAMTISNYGGDCAASLTTAYGQPFDAPLVTIRPLHGDETVVRDNHKTSIEYPARPGYAGHALHGQAHPEGQPGYTTLNVGVDVQPAGAAHTS